MKKILMFSIGLCLMASTVKSEPVSAFEDTLRWFTTSSFMYVARGPYEGDLWMDYGAGYRLWYVKDAHFSVVIRHLKIEEQPVANMNAAVVFVDPINSWLDFMLELGVGNDIALSDGSGGVQNMDWGVIGAIALNLHLGHYTAIYGGVKPFTGAPGKIDFAVGGGVTLYIDEVLKQSIGRIIPQRTK